MDILYLEVPREVHNLIVQNVEFVALDEIYDVPHTNLKDERSVIVFDAGHYNERAKAQIQQILSNYLVENNSFDLEKMAVDLRVKYEKMRKYASKLKERLSRYENPDITVPEDQWA